MKRHFRHTLVLLFCSLPLQCATLERLSLDDMIAKSTAIVRGKVAGSFAALSGQDIYTHYAIQVTERMKGVGGNSVEVLVPGGVANGIRETVSGAPALNPGEEYVFFLWTSRAGATFIIGFTQGLFSVAADGTTDPMAVRSPSRELMLERSTGKSVKEQALSMRLSELRTRVANVNRGIAK